MTMSNSMPKKKVTQYSREQKVEAIKCYHEFKTKIAQVGNVYTADILPAAGTAQYGIEATMPKAQGGTSDPTFNAAIYGDSSYHPEKYLESMQAAVALVDDLYRQLEKGALKDRMLVDMWTAGMTEKEMAKEFDCDRFVVKRSKERLLKMMGE